MNALLTPPRVWKNTKTGRLRGSLTGWDEHLAEGGASVAFVTSQRAYFQKWAKEPQGQTFISDELKKTVRQKAFIWSLKLMEHFAAYEHHVQKQQHHKNDNTLSFSGSN